MAPHDRHDGAAEEQPLLANQTQQHRRRANSITSSDLSTTSTTTSPTIRLSRLRSLAICLSMFTLIFIIPCNVTLMTTIQSAVTASLPALPSWVSWYTSAYLIAVTAVMPLAGRLSQIFTARVYVLGSILVQCVGLLIISLSQSFGMFIFGRVVCGIGAAAVTPVAFLLVTELTDRKNRGVFFGCINTAFTSGVACGAIFAGLLEPVAGWRAVFWVQVPICLGAAGVAFLSIPRADEGGLKGADGDGSGGEKSSVREGLARLDYFGILTLISGVCLLLYALSSPHVTPTPIILAVLDLSLFVAVEAYWAAEPIIPPSVLRHRGNLLTGLATVGLMAARWSVLFYTPLYGIAVRDFAPAKAGVLLIPTDVGFAAGGIVVGWLHIRSNKSYYLPSLITFVLFAATQFTLSRLSTTDSSLSTSYLPTSFFNGFCAGVLLNYTLAHVLFLTPAEAHVVVIPFIAMLRSLAGSFGSAIAGGIFLRTLSASLRQGFDQIQPILGNDWTKERKRELIGRLIGSPNLVYKLLRGGDGDVTPREGRVLFEVALQGYIDAFRTMFMWGSVIALVMAAVQAGTGWRGAQGQEAEEDMKGDGEEEEQQLLGNGQIGGAASTDSGAARPRS
ncbi:Vacuolar basic amino acid transporter 1 [Cyphellophora attinorum]|uniref:Vacuolar basic amino acid transporter 1 n=1 Tax=Cyphellophora attinorum TaxID=1664694 RepID=A0A0N1NWU3_9EURO|nr:Vacuolar basic amino acid transporter 1 [Phialophora attinorum]KPI36580.1 Vacuolar basic amino acid transporter 1 [Phialophora attinorum]